MWRCGGHCPGPQAHRPKKKRVGLSAGEVKAYDLFYAIQDICKDCAVRLLCLEGADLLIQSKRHKYTAIDFAE